jgi:Protein of unknown function (DUF1638)
MLLGFLILFATQEDSNSRGEGSMSATDQVHSVADQRLLVIGCEVLARELQFVAASSPRAVDLVLLSQGLHEAEKPGMAQAIQEAIDAVDEGLYEGIALGYALCNNGIIGIKARGIPVAVPRAHDCIALLLGSHADFQKVFDANPGTYFYSPGWVERDKTNMTHQFTTVLDTMGTGGSYEELVEQYGQENAQYIQEQLQGGLDHYSRGLYIQPSFSVPTCCEEGARAATLEQGWRFEKIAGSLKYLQQICSGQWPEEKFLVLQPGQEIVAGDPGADIIRGKKIS